MKTTIRILAALTILSTTSAYAQKNEDMSLLAKTAASHVHRGEWVSAILGRDDGGYYRIQFDSSSGGCRQETAQVLTTLDGNSSTVEFIDSGATTCNQE